ncbi:pinensin family lanthipeptide [Roseivirga sp. BDSF3-8]
MEPKKLALDALKVESFMTEFTFLWGKKDPTGVYPCGSTVCSHP